MGESAIPQQKIGLAKAVEEVNPTIQKTLTEDERIASLSGDSRWEALKDRITRKMTAAQDSATIGQNTVGMIDDMEIFGFKCALRDLLVEAYQGIINDVELTAKVLNDKKKQDDSGETTI